MERIATSTHQDQLVTRMLRAQSAVATAQIQASSGVKSTDYAGISGQSSRLVNLEDEYNRLDRYIQEGEVVDGRIQTAYDAVGSMVTLTQRLSSLVTSLQGTSASAAGVQEEASALMEEFVALLNTRQEGRYIFAGSKTDSAPVTIDSATYAPVTTAPTTADTSYYLGDSAGTYFQASDDLILDYGVTADDPSIEMALRAFNLLSNLTTDPLDTDAVDEVSVLASDAADGLAVVQTKLGSTAATLERTLDRHLDTQLVLSTQVDDIRSIDVAEASTRLSTLEASLKISVQLMSIVEDNSLWDYL